MLAGLRPEQIPVAEQVLRGGLQAVRQAIEAQNTSNKAAGKPPVASDALLGMADELLPSCAWPTGRTAPRWRRRRARNIGCVSSGPWSRFRTVNLDEEGRTMAKALQESLDQRTTALREEWLARMTNALNRTAGAAGGRRPPSVPRARHPMPGRAGREAGRGRGEAMRPISPRGLDAPARTPLWHRRCGAP